MRAVSVLVFLGVSGAAAACPVYRPPNLTHFLEAQNVVTVVARGPLVERTDPEKPERSWFEARAIVQTVLEGDRAFWKRRNVLIVGSARMFDRFGIDEGRSGGILIAVDSPYFHRHSEVVLEGGPEPLSIGIFWTSCRDTNMYPLDTDIGRALMQVFTTDRDRSTELKILSQYLFGPR